MTPEEYASYDALGLKMLIDKRDISAQELHDIALKAIHACNPELNFMVAFSPDDAKKSLDNFDTKAPFSGVPILVKDAVGMKGQPMSMACRLFEGMLSEDDVECVRRLKKTGVVILGSTITPEWGSSLTTESIMHGACRNPWNIAHSTGGSSGGAAAAVAAGVVPWAQGGDGGGSIRAPAHCCGVFGLTPSRGRIPSPGYGGSILGIGRKHVLTRSVRDSAAMLDQLQGSQPGDLYQLSSPAHSFLSELDASPKPLKIAFSTASPSAYPVDPDCVLAVEQTAKLCESLGHQVEEVGVHYDWERYMEALYDYWAFVYFGGGIGLKEQASGRTVSEETLEPATLKMWDHYQQLTVDRIAISQKALMEIGGIVGEFYDKWDVLLSPCCLSPAPPLGTLWSSEATRADAMTVDGQMRQFGPYTAVSNTSGQPSVSIPMYQSKDGLPVGVLCTSQVGDEAALIRLAGQLEAANPWASRHPKHGIYSG